MESSTVGWPSETEDHDPAFTYQHEMRSLNQFTAQQSMESREEDFQHPLSSGNYAPYFSIDPSARDEFNDFSCSSMEAYEMPFNSMETEGGGPVFVPDASSVSIHSFGNLNSVHDNHRKCSDFSGGSIGPGKERKDLSSPGSTWNENMLDFQRPERNNVANQTPSCTQEHVIAERKRREKLSQHFIALSSIIPGLKKTDKASLLGDAANYVKQLEARVKTLEEQVTEKSIESVIVMKESHLANNSDSSSNKDGCVGSVAPLKIEGIVNGRTVLMRIHCEKHKGVLVKLISEIEKNNLSVINTTLMPFGSSSLNITLTAQIEEGFSITMKDLVKDLNSSLSQFM